MTPTIAEKLTALERLGYDCDTADGEVTTWRDNRTKPETWEEIIAAADLLAQAATARAAARATLRTDWSALPSWIRGPYRPLFDAANQLLDEGADEDAVAMIEYAEPMPAFSAEQVATFEQVRATFAAAIAALPALN